MGTRLGLSNSIMLNWYKYYSTCVNSEVFYIFLDSRDSIGTCTVFFLYGKILKFVIGHWALRCCSAFQFPPYSKPAEWTSIFCFARSKHLYSTSPHPFLHSLEGKRDIAECHQHLRKMFESKNAELWLETCNLVLPSSSHILGVHWVET